MNTPNPGETPPKKSAHPEDQAQLDFIAKTFENIAKSVDGASLGKIKQYVERIRGGEDKAKTLEGLGPSFIGAVEQLLEAYEKPEASAEGKEKTITLEDIQKLEDEEKTLENQKAEKEAEEKKILGVTPGTTSADPTPTSSPTPGATAPTSDEEKERKLRELQKGIIADRKREKERKAQGFLYEAKNEQDQKIEDTRKEYIDAYGQSVKNVGGIRKTFNKLGNWLGMNTKDAFTNSTKTYEDRLSSVTKTAYETEKDLKGDKTLDTFATKRIEDRKGGKTDSEAQALKERYKRMITNKNEAFSNRDFDFVQNENATLRQEKGSAWEANRSKNEIRAEQAMAKAGEWFDKHPNIKKTIGTKWFRFVVGTGVAASFTLLSGGALGGYFFINRATRFVAGSIVGAKIGKLAVQGLEKGKLLEQTEERIILGKTEKVLASRMQKLENQYRNGEITASQYDSGREAMDLKIKRLNATRMAIVGGSAISLGMGATQIEHDVFGWKGGTVEDTEVKKPPATTIQPKETVSVTDANTQIELDKNVPVKQSIADTLKEQPKPAIDSTHPTNNGASGTETAPTPVNTAPETKPVTTTPDEHTIVKAGSGKGIEHAFRAQIEHDQALAEKLKELYHYKGAIGTPEELHKFSGVVAHQMALGEGYVGADGAERWVTGTASYDIEIENGEVVIHERALDAQGSWSETENSSGTFETDADKNASGGVYEKTHTPHHDVERVSEIKKSLHSAYENDRPKIQVTPEDGKPGAIDLPPPTNKAINLPPPTNLNRAIDLPPPTIQQHPTVPVRPMQSYPVMPRTYDPRPMNPGPANPMSNMIGAVESTPSSGKSFLDILFEGFFGPEKPSTPTPLETPRNGGEGIA